ncbi:MAG TPA: DNA repair protein RecO [Candidatus Cloacimonadota bacterium]|nr:DNA repair protein RecO [Candidatus Cloacimonadota bacterium]HPS39556.1 DNA repair protein RecO [Candidatus Cloacimonadota bacterium]
MRQKIHERGIILKLTPYGDTSLVVRCLTHSRGIISFLAKGLRKATDKTQLVLLQEYDLFLYPPTESGLYLFGSAEPLTENTIYLKPQIWAAAECGIELLENLEFSDDETSVFYDLTLKYLSYLDGITTNGILIFWRYFLRVLKVAGLEMRSDHCANCGSPGHPIIGLDMQTGLLICEDCPDPVREAVILLSSKASGIYNALPGIGALLDQIRLNRELILEINEFFLRYWECHYHKTLKLKSLSVLCQFYPL